MASYSRTQTQQLLHEVEGYLDLAMVLADKYPLSSASRDRIANRALRTLDRLSEATQQGAKGLHLRGQALRVLERYEDAVVPLQAAREADPENVYVLLALGWCFKRLEKIELAIQALEDALARCPDMAIIHYNLACYWSLANNTPLALVYLAQSFDLDPDCRDLVQDETDFDALRSHPEFIALTSVIV